MKRSCMFIFQWDLCSKNGVQKAYTDTSTIKILTQFFTDLGRIFSVSHGKTEILISKTIWNHQRNAGDVMNPHTGLVYLTQDDFFSSSVHLLENSFQDA